jgi:hypothetical protein
MKGKGKGVKGEEGEREIADLTRCGLLFPFTLFSFYPFTPVL